jgi:hypothetical protein
MLLKAPYHFASVSSTLAKLVVTSVFPTAICELILCSLGLDHCTEYTEPRKMVSGLVEINFEFLYSIYIKVTLQFLLQLAT